MEKLKEVEGKAQERTNSKLEVEISSLVLSVQADISKLEARRTFWPEFAVTDMENNIRGKEERLEELKKIKNKASEHHQQLHRRRVQYCKKQI